jgi:hypothetical protein
MKKLQCVCAIGIAGIAIASALDARPAFAFTTYYRNACAWSINSYCANRRAKGLPTGGRGWARRNGYTGYTGR